MCCFGISLDGQMDEISEYCIGKKSYVQNENCCQNKCVCPPNWMFYYIILVILGLAYVIVSFVLFASDDGVFI